MTRRNGISGISLAFAVIASLTLRGLSGIAGSDGAGEAQCPIFPRPKVYSVKDGGRIALLGPAVIVLGAKAEEPERFAASRLACVLKRRFGIDAPVVTEERMTKGVRNFLLLGTPESNSLLQSLVQEHKIDLSSLQGKDPMQDAFAVEVMQDGDRHLVLLVGTAARPVIYAQYAFLDAVTRDGEKVVYPNMSVRDWSSLRYRDWWPGNFGPEQVSVYDDEDSLNQITYARANMTMFRGFDSSVVSADVIRECRRRGLRLYGTIDGAVGVAVHPHSVELAKSWLDKGCDGLYISFDDFGMGSDPAGLCNKMTAVLRERFGEVGDRIAVVTSCPDYYWLNSGENRRVRNFAGFEEAIFYFTGDPFAPFRTKEHFEQARAAGIRNHVWWHNYPIRITSFYTPAPARRYYALLPFNLNCWGRFTFDEMRKGGEHLTGMSAQNEDFHYVALQLFWAWDPAQYDYERARTAIYRQRHGAAAVEAVRKLDDNMYKLSEYFDLMWRDWAKTAWTLKDVSQRGEALALIDEMRGQLEAIRNGKKYSCMSEEGYDKNFIAPLEAHLDAGQRLAKLDFPDYAVRKREGPNPKEDEDLLKAHAADTLRTKMVDLIWAGRRSEAQAYLADLRREAVPMLDVIEKELRDLWYTEEYVNAWRAMLTLEHWESVAAETFGEEVSVKIGRNADGLVVMEPSVENCDVLYTVDGPEPTEGSAEVYGGPLELSRSCVIRAVVVARDSGLRTRVSRHVLGVPKNGWKVIYTDSDNGVDFAGANAIDGHLDTFWITEKGNGKPAHPHEIRIDLGRETDVGALGIHPRRHNGRGVPKRYELYAGADGNTWGDPVTSGEIAGLGECMMIVPKEALRTRFLRLVILSAFRSVHFSAIAELDVFNLPPRPGVGPEGDVRPGLRYRYYEAMLGRCGELEDCEPLREGVIATPTIEIEGRAKEKFGFIYEGYVRIPEDGFYTFSVESDDGSMFWLDGRPVVENDGAHAPEERSAGLSLAKGYHKIRLAYFERTGGECLNVYWQRPGEEKELLPAAILFHEVK